MFLHPKILFGYSRNFSQKKFFFSFNENKDFRDEEWSYKEVIGLIKKSWS